LPPPDYRFSYILYGARSNSVIFSATLAASLPLAMAMQKIFSRIFPQIR